MVSPSNLTRRISLNNQPLMTRPTAIDWNSDSYNQVLHYYPFMINLDRCGGTCNTLDEPSGKICVPNKKEDINLYVFNMITEINEAKNLTKQISCKCRYKFDGRKCKSDQK